MYFVFDSQVLRNLTFVFTPKDYLKPSCVSRGPSLQEAGVDKRCRRGENRARGLCAGSRLRTPTLSSTSGVRSARRYKTICASGRSGGRTLTVSEQTPLDVLLCRAGQKSSASWWFSFDLARNQVGVRRLENDPALCLVSIRRSVRGYDNCRRKS